MKQIWLLGSLIGGYNFLFGDWSEPDFMFRTVKRHPFLRHLLNNAPWVVKFLYHRRWLVYLIVSRLNNLWKDCEESVRYTVGYPPKGNRTVTARNQELL